MLENNRCFDECRRVTNKLLAYCEANNWAGYDPYDALNSKIFTALPFLNSRIPRLAFTQALKRSPFNIRRLALIPKVENPKGTGLFLDALLNIDKVSSLRHDELIARMVDKLCALRSAGTPHWCWGYSFPWQTRTIVVPRWAPNAVCTSFVSNAMLNAFEQFQNSRLLEIAVSAGD